VTGRVAEGRPDTAKLSPRQLEDLRADLAGADAGRAHRALWTLASAPTQAIPLFRGQLRPVVAADAERVAGLLADLNSADFARRNRATKDIQKMGDGALPALHKALADRPPLEVRRRVERLLEGLAAWSPEQLYALRAVEILECIGSPGAREVLDALAKGVPEAFLTREAQASLSRLSRRSPALP
jgi:hypothetical protein